MKFVLEVLRGMVIGLANIIRRQRRHHDGVHGHL